MWAASLVAATRRVVLAPALRRVVVSARASAAEQAPPHAERVRTLSDVLGERRSELAAAAAAAMARVGTHVDAVRATGIAAASVASREQPADSDTDARSGEQLPVASAYRLATRMNQALEQYWRPPQGRHRDALLARSPDPRDFWVGRQRSVHAYHELLQIQGAHGHVDAAVITLDEVVAAGMMPTPNMLSTMVHVYASHGRLHEAEAMLGDMRNRRVPLSAAPYTSLAHAYGVRGQLNSAFALRERMHADGVAPDAAFFTTLMHSVLRAGQYARVFRVFEDMCDEGVEADQVTFNVMLLACGRMRNAERAFSLWSNMRIHNLTPTDFNFEAVLYALSTSPHMYDRVFEVYEQYVGEGFKPTTYAYDMLLLATARAGRVKDSQAVMLDMREKGVQPTTSSYNHVLLAYFMSLCNDRSQENEVYCVRNAGEVFRIMRDEKLADRVSYNLMMRVLAKARRRKLLHELLGQHRAAGYERDARDLLVELELELDNRRLDAAWKAYEAIARETDGMLRGKLSPASALFVGDDGDDILVDDGGDDSSVRADDDGSGVQLLPAAAAGTALAVADRPSSGLAVARAVTDARRVRAKALTSLLRKAVDLGRSEVAIDCVRELNAIEAPPPGDAYRLLLKLRAVGPPALHEQLQALLPPLPAAKHVRRFVPMKGVPRT